MNIDYEKKYHNLERQWWWFVARRQTILTLLKDAPKNAKILDIGCSGGVLLQALTEAGFTNVYGIDYSAKAIEKCIKIGLENVYVMDAHNPEFPPESFDIIIASDCLEHLEKDELALKNWHSILKKNGKGLIFVPAFMSLWSEHDVKNHHHRRYTKHELAEKAKKSGFTIKRKSYWNFTLFIPVLIIRTLKRLLGNKNKQQTDDLQKINTYLNKILIGVMSVENFLFKIFNFPFGVSTMVTVEK